MVSLCGEKRPSVPVSTYILWTIYELGTVSFWIVYSVRYLFFFKEYVWKNIKTFMSRWRASGPLSSLSREWTWPPPVNTHSDIGSPLSPIVLGHVLWDDDLYVLSSTSTVKDILTCTHDPGTSFSTDVSKLHTGLHYIVVNIIITMWVNPVYSYTPVGLMSSIVKNDYQRT